MRITRPRADRADRDRDDRREERAGAAHASAGDDPRWLRLRWHGARRSLTVDEESPRRAPRPLLGRGPPARRPRSRRRPGRAHAGHVRPASPGARGGGGLLVPRDVVRLGPSPSSRSTEVHDVDRLAGVVDGVGSAAPRRQWIRRSWPRQYGSRSARFRSLPDGLRGRVSAEVDRGRALVAREPLPRVRDDVVGIGRGTSAAHDDGLDRLARGSTAARRGAPASRDSRSSAWRPSAGRWCRTCRATSRRRPARTGRRGRRDDGGQPTCD